MAGKDATLESLRVSVRKIEQALAPLLPLAARLATLERKLLSLDAKIGALLGKRIGLGPLPNLAGLVEEEPPPAEPPAALPPTTEDIGLVLRTAVADLGVELRLMLGELVTAVQKPPARPVKNGAPRSDDLGDLNIDPKSVVSFEQTKG